MILGRPCLSTLSPKPPQHPTPFHFYRLPDYVTLVKPPCPRNLFLDETAYDHFMPFTLLILYFLHLRVTMDALTVSDRLESL